ncbi:hypothetical protein GCM10009647_052980 [Streptomyces sanglieri]
MGVRPGAVARFPAGRGRLDDPRGLNGIVWKLRTGTAWRDVPERYGPWATFHARFRKGSPGSGGRENVGRSSVRR